MLAVIGGSGVYNLDGLKKARWTAVESPFGRPSDDVLLTVHELIRKVRSIILDTEATGLDPLLGHRSIEIAAVELLVDTCVAHNRFHRYIDPDYSVDVIAKRSHFYARPHRSTGSETRTD